MKEQKRDISWDEIVTAAKAEQPLRSLIDPDYGNFFAPGKMVRKIMDYCKKTNQPIPENMGQIAR